LRPAVPASRKPWVTIALRNPAARKPWVAFPGHPRDAMRRAPGHPCDACVAPVRKVRCASDRPTETHLYRLTESPFRLAFGELRAATRLATTDFLAFDFTRIAGDESCLA